MGLCMSRPLPRGRYRLGFLAELERDWRGLLWFGTTIGSLSGVGLVVWVPFPSFFGSVGHTLRSVVRPVEVRPVWCWFVGSLGVVWLGCSAVNNVFSTSHCGLFPGGSLGRQSRTISRPCGVFSSHRVGDGVCVVARGDRGSMSQGLASTVSSSGRLVSLPLAILGRRADRRRSCVPVLPVLSECLHLL
jgi:hypothetical protein